MSIGKKILSMDKALSGETKWLECCWSDCQKTGTTLHKVMFHDHNSAIQCDDILAKHVWYTFCSEKHRQYHINSHISNGNLPVGERGRII